MPDRIDEATVDRGTQARMPQARMPRGGADEPADDPSDDRTGSSWGSDRRMYNAVKAKVPTSSTDVSLLTVAQRRATPLRMGAWRTIAARPSKRKAAAVSSVRSLPSVQR
jgi:hypothetical protein